jgi:hypothetical protein
MATGNSFRTLLAKVRSGDEAAAAELVQQYEPVPPENAILAGGKNADFGAEP